MGLGQFYIFAAIFGYFVIATGGLLIFAYKMNNTKMIQIFRFFLVLFTIGGFFNLFIDDMRFDDVNNEGLNHLAYHNGTA